MPLEPFIGDITMVAFNFAPRGWALCNGQLLSIQQNQALFSILGVTYGGNGTTNFALPDLRGRVPIHSGQRPGGSPFSLGQRSGEATHTLIVPEIPAHNHPTLNVSSLAGSQFVANNNTLGVSAAKPYTPVPANGGVMGAATRAAGGGQAHENMQPYLALNFVIALVGIFPSRN
jgi:microcystin-dependent protein